jgi:hypothetical protein
MTNQGKPVELCRACTHRGGRRRGAKIPACSAEHVAESFPLFKGQSRRTCLGNSYKPITTTRFEGDDSFAAASFNRVEFSWCFSSMGTRCSVAKYGQTGVFPKSNARLIGADGHCPIPDRKVSKKFKLIIWKESPRQSGKGS